jgi:hypothetical protein
VEYLELELELCFFSNFGPIACCEQTCVGLHKHLCVLMEPAKPPAAAGNKAILSALHQPVWEVLASSTNVLISGCGGGYDFFRFPNMHFHAYRELYSPLL